MKLSDLWDLDQHELTADEDFASDATGVLHGLDKTDEKVYGWEAPAKTARVEYGTPSPWNANEMRSAQGWGAFAMEARRLAHCLGVGAEMYQHNLFTPDGKKVDRVAFTVQIKQENNSNWEGGRL